MVSLKLAAPGSTVRLLQGNIDVLVEDVNITGTVLLIKYFVVFWKDGERKGIWVCANEIDLPESIVRVELTSNDSTIEE